MSLFEGFGTPQGLRRQLFWLVCIWFRLLVAAVAAVVTAQGSEGVGIAIGALVATGGIGFWVQRCRDNKENIWWFRSLHGLIWFGTGIATAAVAGTESPVGAAIVVGTGLGTDVAVGVATAVGWLDGLHSRRGDLLLGTLPSNGPGWVNEASAPGMFPTIFTPGWSVFGRGDSAKSMLTPWSAVHFLSGFGLGIAAHYLNTDNAALGILLALMVLVLWEGIENAKPGIVKGAVFAVTETLGIGCLGRKANNSRPLEPDSAINSLTDMIVGGLGVAVGVVVAIYGFP